MRSKNETDTYHQLSCILQTYSGKLSREKTFEEENFRGLSLCRAKGHHTPNFVEKTFRNSHKTAKFAKVFSLEKYFQIYIIPLGYFKLSAFQQGISNHQSQHMNVAARPEDWFYFSLITQQLFEHHYYQLNYAAQTSADPDKIQHTQLLICTNLRVTDAC